MKLEALLLEVVCGNRKLGEEIALTVDGMTFARITDTCDAWRTLAEEICETMSYDPTSNSRPPKVIRIDRGARHQQRASEVRQSARLIIDRNFAQAQDIYDQVRSTTASEATKRAAAAKLYQLWGYVDGLLYGQTESCLSPNESSALRKEWNDKCDEAFGDLVGETLSLHTV